MQGRRIRFNNQTKVILYMRERIENLNDSGLISNPRRLELISKLTEAEEHFLTIEKILSVIVKQVTAAETKL